jgi:hypothetical protein
MTSVLEENKSVNLGVRFPSATLNKLDKYKGYHSRNMYLCKIVDEHIARLERAKETATTGLGDTNNNTS